LRTESVDKLFEAILLLKNKEECYSFFEDIGTVSEIKAFAQRLEVAKMLDEGKTYREIHEKTGASEATISRSAVLLITGRMATALYLNG